MRTIGFAIVVAFSVAVAGTAGARTPNCTDASGQPIACPSPADVGDAPASRPRRSPPPKPSNATATSLPSATPSGATAQRQDGTVSMNQGPSAMCSHHGGVVRWLSH